MVDRQGIAPTGPEYYYEGEPYYAANPWYYSANPY